MIISRCIVNFGCGSGVWDSKVVIFDEVVGNKNSHRGKKTGDSEI